MSNHMEECAAEFLEECGKPHSFSKMVRGGKSNGKLPSGKSTVTLFPE